MFEEFEEQQSFMQSYHIFNVKTRNEYNKFFDSQSRKDWHAVICANIFIFIVSFLAVSNFIQRFDPSENVIYANLALISVFSSWLIRFIVHLLKCFVNENEHNDMVVFFDSFGLFLLVLSSELLLIMKVKNGSCTGIYEHKLWQCNTEHDSNMIPVQQMLVMMFAPIFYKILFHSRMKLTFIVWISVLITFLIAINIIGFSPSTTFILCVYTLISFLILIQIRRHRITYFYRSKQLEFLLSENERLDT
jgi:hypothetical protein